VLLVPVAVLLLAVLLGMLLLLAALLPAVRLLPAALLLSPVGLITLKNVVFLGPGGYRSILASYNFTS
jgi:hypothetical protein